MFSLQTVPLFHLIKCHDHNWKMFKTNDIIQKNQLVLHVKKKKKKKKKLSTIFFVQFNL